MIDFICCIKIYNITLHVYHCYTDENYNNLMACLKKNLDYCVVMLIYISGKIQIYYFLKI
jgi:hypothetical protein